jgi:hypothetical protein
LFVTLFALSMFAFARWVMPYLTFEIYDDRFELRKPGTRRVIPLDEVSSIEFATTEFHERHGIKTGQLTNYQLVLKTTEGKSFEFAPRTGALATWLRARSVLNATRLPIGRRS